jgi:hypothetical protein
MKMNFVKQGEEKFQCCREGSTRNYFRTKISRAAEKKKNNGAGDRDRTGDIQLGKLAFYR